MGASTWKSKSLPILLRFVQDIVCTLPEDDAKAEDDVLAFQDLRLDQMDYAYQKECERWCYRYNDLKPHPGYELVRNSSPNNNINADEYFEITTFTKRECPDRDSAAQWLDAYRGRAAMRAAIRALRWREVR